MINIEENSNLIDFSNKDILTIAPIAIFTCDLNCHITSWNKRAQDITGYTEGDLLGLSCCVLKLGCRKDKCILSVDKSARPYIGKECKIVSKTGSDIFILKNANVLTDKSGNVIGSIEVFTDITERKLAEKNLYIAKAKLERKLKEEEENKRIMLSLLEDVVETRDKLDKMARELVRSNHDLEQYAYIASHDLQEPIRSVIGYIQLLKEKYQGKFDSEADSFMNYAVEGSLRMKDLINDILAYSRIGHYNNAMAEVDCNVIIEYALQDLKAKIKEADAIITRDNLPVIFGERAQISQLFRNIIGNSLKFRSSKRPEIYICSKETEDEWIISLRDNGIGLKQKYQKEIFEIFRRVYGRNKYEGSGIGLAICKKIMYYHNGHIWVESTPDEGATFYLAFPKKFNNHRR